MPITMVLAIGLDTAFLELQNHALKAAGYFVSSAQSVEAAMEEFREGDFDLVLIGKSVEPLRQEQLTALIRDTGSHVPVVCVAEPSSYFKTLEVASAQSRPLYVMRSIGDLVANQKKPVARATAVDSERLRRAAG
jgi:DNA-binding NtrC family response regulator